LTFIVENGASQDVEAFLAKVKRACAIRLEGTEDFEMMKTDLKRKISL
jgi:hypothetical protein